MNKASCMEAEYQYSLIVQKLDQDITKSHFNDSLNDFGKLIDKLPDTLDACNQKHLAELVRKNFPQECVTSLGLFVRELVEIEHHYTHLEWLKAHWRDFVHAIAELRSTCPALERR